MATERRVADDLVGALEQAGVDRVFGIPGGAISPFFDALLDSGIDVVACQHEAMAVYAAGGYARASGRPGVVAVTSGPGLLNALTGIAAARLDELPVLVLAGDVARASHGRGALQDGGPGALDVAAVARPLAKRVETLVHPQRAAAMIQQALRDASATPAGSVVLSLPVDVLLQGGGRGEVLLAPAGLPGPDPATCARIAATLGRARRPALMLGVGARRPGCAPAVLALAEWLRCPVFTDVEAKGVFPESHPLSLGVFGVGETGRAREYLAGGVDVLVTLGARLDDTTTASWSELLSAPATVIQVDHDADRLRRAYAVQLAVHGDLAGIVAAVRAACGVPSMELFVARDRAIRAVARVVPEAPPMDVPPFDPRAVVRALQIAFGPTAVFVCDIGNHMLFAAQGLTIDAPDGFFVANGLGGMGSGLGHAIGLQLAFGSRRQVVAICGDGTLHLAGSELATCAQHEIPLVVVVFDDGQLGMVQHGIERLFGRSHRWTTRVGGLVGFARALGVEARRVESFADIASAAGRGRRGPTLLDVGIDPGVRIANPRVGTVRGSAGAS